MHQRKKNTFIGIDLGTSFSAVAVIEGDVKEPSPRNISLGPEGKLLPTLVDFTPYVPEVGRVVWGDTRNVITGSDFKSALGKGKRFKLPNPGRSRNIIDPQEVAVEVLRHLKTKIEDDLHIEKWEEVDITLAIPAFLQDNEADRTEVFRAAALMAGFPQVRILEEPIAALFDIDFEKDILSLDDRVILLLDYGGGTCDVAVIRTGYRRVFKRGDRGKILGVASEECGGEFIDAKIADWLREENRIEAIRPFFLKEEARKLKEKLCGRWQGKEEELEGNFDITTEEFIHLSKPIVEKMFRPIEQAIEEAKKRERKWSRGGNSDSFIDMIVLTGGMSKCPLIGDMLRERYPQIATTDDGIVLAPHPQLNVSKGAALYGLYRTMQSVKVYDELEHDLFLLFPDGKRKRLLGKGARVPSKKPKCFVVKVTQPTDTVILNLWVREGKEYKEYAEARLEFDEEISAGEFLYLEVEVSLRRHIYIVGKVGAQYTDTVMKRPL